MKPTKINWNDTGGLPEVSNLELKVSNPKYRDLQNIKDFKFKSSLKLQKIKFIIIQLNIIRSDYKLSLDN